MLLGVSSCTFGAQPHTASPNGIIEPVVPSAFVAVVSETHSTGRAWPNSSPTPSARASISTFSELPAATVLRAATRRLRARVIVPASPLTRSWINPIQQAKYHQSLARWQHDVASAKEVVASQTRAALTTWVSSLSIAQKVNRLPGSAGDLASDCAIAAGVLADLEETVGASFSGRRVVLLYPPNLDGSLPPGELTGVDVIVVTSFLPSAATVSAAQAMLLADGAAKRATIVGPEFTAAQLSQLVTLGLSQTTSHRLPLRRRAVRQRQCSAGAGRSPRAHAVDRAAAGTGAAAVINGYASTPGTSRRITSSPTPGLTPWRPSSRRTESQPPPSLSSAMAQMI